MCSWRPQSIANLQPRPHDVPFDYCRLPPVSAKRLSSRQPIRDPSLSKTSIHDVRVHDVWNCSNSGAFFFGSFMLPLPTPPFQDLQITRSGQLSDVKQPVPPPAFLWFCTPQLGVAASHLLSPDALISSQKDRIELRSRLSSGLSFTAGATRFFPTALDRTRLRRSAGSPQPPSPHR